MSRASASKRIRHAEGRKAFGKASAGQGSVSATENAEIGRYNINDVHAFVVILFIAVFILGLMIKITFF